MTTPAERERWARAVLAGGGLVTVIAGATGIGLGRGAAGWLYSLLPPVEIDAAAVGGATVALGIGLGLVGALQLLAAARHGRQPAWERTATATLAALIGATLASSGAAAFTAAATSAQPWLVALGLALVGAALAYGVTAWRLARPSV